MMNSYEQFQQQIQKTRQALKNNKMELEYDEYKLNKAINQNNIEIGIGLNEVDNLKPSKYFYELSKENKEWIENSKDIKILEAKLKILKASNEKALSHHQYLSRLSLGIIVYMIKKEKLQKEIVNLKSVKFKKYDKSNREYFFFTNGRKSSFNNFDKVDIVLSLLHILRNRSYHWENILKTTRKNNKTFPRITTIIQGTHIGLNPSKIEIFLDDLIKIFDERLLDYC